MLMELEPEGFPEKYAAHRSWSSIVTNKSKIGWPTCIQGNYRPSKRRDKTNPGRVEALLIILTRSIWKMLGPFATASRRTRHSPGVATAACASMSATTTTTTTTATTTRDRVDRYGPMEWAQLHINARKKRLVRQADKQTPDRYFSEFRILLMSWTAW